MPNGSILLHLAGWRTRRRRPQGSECSNHRGATGGDPPGVRAQGARPRAPLPAPRPPRAAGRCARHDTGAPWDVLVPVADGGTARGGRVGSCPFRARADRLRQLWSGGVDAHRRDGSRDALRPVPVAGGSGSRWLGGFRRTLLAGAGPPAGKERVLRSRRSRGRATPDGRPAIRMRRSVRGAVPDV